ncbi:MAG TPA: OB-fold domain-containing protein [Acidimicrobiales bacterium]|nr:OB-fold domain-containing protein [Acidimicrobiales bacterium]
MADQVPLVDYLVLDDPPHLVANRCAACGATFFDRRNACAACSRTEFTTTRVATEGTLRAYTIVAFAAAGVPVPYVAAVVDCDGIEVRANIVGVEPDPAELPFGLPVRLTTFPMGTDSAGTEAIAFGFTPMTTNPGAQP